jgi:hypothetical protein
MLGHSFGLLLALFIPITASNENQNQFSETCSASIVHSTNEALLPVLNQLVTTSVFRYVKVIYSHSPGHFLHLLTSGESSKRVSVLERELVMHSQRLFRFRGKCRGMKRKNISMSLISRKFLKTLKKKLKN